MFSRFEKIPDTDTWIHYTRCTYLSDRGKSQQTQVTQQKSTTFSPKGTELSVPWQKAPVSTELQMVMSECLRVYFTFWEPHSPPCVPAFFIMLNQARDCLTWQGQLHACVISAVSCMRPVLGKGLCAWDLMLALQGDPTSPS